MTVVSLALKDILYLRLGFEEPVREKLSHHLFIENFYQGVVIRS